MGKITDEFEQFYQEQLKREPEMLRRMIAGWEVVDCHGGEDHRLLLLKNAQGEKRVLKQFSHGQNARVRAEHEALTAAQGPGIPKLYEFNEDEHSVYLMREYIEGVNLEEHVQQHGLMDVRETARIAQEICRLLSVLHRHGIIHRDIKPQNVILTPDGRVYLIDFDISRKFSQGEDHDTVYMGTRDIAPPEQFGFGQTDARTDVYSLGVVMHFLLTGGYELRDIDTLPKPIRRVVRRCTYFAPAQRYQSAAQLMRKLVAVERRRARILTASITMLILLAGLGGGWLLLHPQPRVFPVLSTLPADAQASFAEPLIERCVRATLGKAADAPLTVGEVSTVTEIYVYGDITDGKPHDVDYRGTKVYIDGVVVHHGSITTLSDLLMMPKLRVLSLYRQVLASIDELAPLSKLEELYLDQCWNVRDIAALDGLVWLRTLDLSSTAVSDLSPLKGCPRLRRIDLERIPCEDYRVLSRYSYLEYLNVSEASPQAVIDAVSGKMVDYLWLDRSGLTDIEPFLRAEGVQELHAKNNNITSLEGIQALTMLGYVDVAYNPVTDLSPLLELPRLSALRIDRSMTAAWEAIQPQAKFNVEWQE